MTSGPDRRAKDAKVISLFAGALKARKGWRAAPSAGRATRRARQARSISRPGKSRAGGSNRADLHPQWIAGGYGGAPKVINPPLAEFNGSIGLPISSTEISIRDDAGNDLDVGQVGEICVRGPQVMKGYWKRPDETAKVMLPGDWLRTGDIGRMDERGFVYIEDRKKDMILVSGFNVYPNELEEVVAHHPGVLEVAAIGVPDEHSGEVPQSKVATSKPSRRLRRGLKMRK